jgi:hypothetical protein
MNYININNKEEENEIKALEYFKENELDKAENTLRKNLEIGTGTSKTYDLLLKIYYIKKDYSSLIKTLNDRIKNSSDKDNYRKIRKAIILNKLLEDINSSDEIDLE